MLSTTPALLPPLPAARVCSGSSRPRSSASSPRPLLPPAMLSSSTLAFLRTRLARRTSCRSAARALVLVSWPPRPPRPPLTSPPLST
ncbi:hypothetical protein BN1708_009585, partial [Verticillium longisporum]